MNNRASNKKLENVTKKEVKRSEEKTGEKRNNSFLYRETKITSSADSSQTLQAENQDKIKELAAKEAENRKQERNAKADEVQQKIDILQKNNKEVYAYLSGNETYITDDPAKAAKKYQADAIANLPLDRMSNEGKRVKRLEPGKAVSQIRLYGGDVKVDITLPEAEKFQTKEINPTETKNPEHQSKEGPSALQKLERLLERKLGDEFWDRGLQRHLGKSGVETQFDQIEGNLHVLKDGNTFYVTHDVNKTKERLGNVALEEVTVTDELVKQLEAESKKVNSNVKWDFEVSAAKSKESGEILIATNKEAVQEKIDGGWVELKKEAKKEVNFFDFQKHSDEISDFEAAGVGKGLAGYEGTFGEFREYEAINVDPNQLDKLYKAFQETEEGRVINSLEQDISKLEFSFENLSQLHPENKNGLYQEIIALGREDRKYQNERLLAYYQSDGINSKNKEIESMENRLQESLDILQNKYYFASLENDAKNDILQLEDRFDKIKSLADQNRMSKYMEEEMHRLNDEYHTYRDDYVQERLNINEPNEQSNKPLGLIEKNLRDSISVLEMNYYFSSLERDGKQEIIQSETRYQKIRSQFDQIDDVLSETQEKFWKLESQYFKNCEEYLQERIQEDVENKPIEKSNGPLDTVRKALNKMLSFMKKELEKSFLRSDEGKEIKTVLDENHNLLDQINRANGDTNPSGLKEFVTQANQQYLKAMSEFMEDHYKPREGDERREELISEMQQTLKYAQDHLRQKYLSQTNETVRSSDVFQEKNLPLTPDDKLKTSNTSYEDKELPHTPERKPKEGDSSPGLLKLPEWLKSSELCYQELRNSDHGMAETNTALKELQTFLDGIGESEQYFLKNKVPLETIYLYDGQGGSLEEVNEYIEKNWPKIEQQANGFKGNLDFREVKSTLEDIDNRLSKVQIAHFMLSRLPQRRSDNL